MSAATFLTGLYPPAVRDRWGADLREEVAGSGISSWPDTLAGAVRLWLHPSDWPETSTGQNRRVVTVMLFTIMAAAVLLLRTVDPTTTLTADLHHPLTSLWLVPLLLGLLLAAPLPPLGTDPLQRLATTAARTMAAPTAAVVAMFALAWTGLAQQVTGLADIAVSTYYWATLGFVAWRGCVLIARTAQAVTPPSARRPSIALLLTGSGLTLAASQSLLSLAGTELQPTSAVQTLTLGLLAATALSAGQDLHTAR